MRRGARAQCGCSLSRALVLLLVPACALVLTLTLLRRRAIAPAASRSSSDAAGGRASHAMFTKPTSVVALEDVFSHMQAQDACRDSPIFVTMASVGSDIYWQLIENFIYTMERFSLLPCALMICVSDQLCVDLCREHGFPCYDYRHQQTDAQGKPPHTMEQIAHLKLLHIPKALRRGVDVFMLDLDVGFYANPMSLIRHYQLSSADTFVQEDLVFIMHRSVARWKEWWTEPMPNIGLMLCKGNTRNVAMFAHAWDMYCAINKPIKHNPGKDQNKVVAAMKSARANGFKWEYFPNTSAVLMDKLWKFVNSSVELGGVVSQEILSGMVPSTVAVHTTCYEQRTKVMGLKALGAFWTPHYYNIRRKTLTKQLIFRDMYQMERELRSLVYLAMQTGRALIVPNVLGPDWMLSGGEYRGRRLWPGFRVAYFKSNIVEVLEPAFYWRAEQLVSAQVAPKILSFASAASVGDIQRALAQEPHPRVVLHVGAMDAAHSTRITAWAVDSVGLFADYKTELGVYGEAPELKEAEGGARVASSVGLCRNVFVAYKGNRSCFEACDPPHLH